MKIKNVTLDLDAINEEPDSVLADTQKILDTIAAALEAIGYDATTYQFTTQTAVVSADDTARYRRHLLAEVRRDLAKTIEDLRSGDVEGSVGPEELEEWRTFLLAQKREFEDALATLQERLEQGSPLEPNE